MNKDRRNSLKNILIRLIALQDELALLRKQEIEYRDNIPEHLINSKRYNKADEAVDQIGGAIEELDPIIDYIKNVIN